MADPKYANLPGIAYDQQDVYETSDLPESEQDAKQEVQEENDGIERIHLNSSEAYGKFKDKSLDSSNADFSDRIGQGRYRGYDVGEYEMAADGMAETPQQKYQRLRHEMGLLVDEISKIKEKDGKQEKGSDRFSAVELGKQAEVLHTELRKIKLEKVLGTELMDELSDPQGTLQKKLLVDLENFKRNSSTTNKEATSKGPSTSSATSSSEQSVVYELHYRPEVAKFNQTSQLAELDQRLQKLETIIGPKIEKAVSLSSDTDNRSVTSSIAVLNSKLNLLDAAHLDQVETHLAALSLRLAQLAEKKTVVEDAEKLSKVSQLYDLLKKNEDLCAHLPDIVERLTVLKDLHEQAMQFSTALTQLDATQKQISVDLKNNQDVLAGVQSEFAKNIEIIKANAASLDARITASKK